MRKRCPLLPRLWRRTSWAWTAQPEWQREIRSEATQLATAPRARAYAHARGQPGDGGARARADRGRRALGRLRGAEVAPGPRPRLVVPRRSGRPARRPRLDPGFDADDRRARARGRDRRDQRLAARLRA